MSLNKPIFKLRDWIDIEKLNFTILSSNPSAIELLKTKPKEVVWYQLSSNPNAIELLKMNPRKIMEHYIMASWADVMETWLNTVTIYIFKKNIRILLKFMWIFR